MIHPKLLKVQGISVPIAPSNQHKQDNCTLPEHVEIRNHNGIYALTSRGLSLLRIPFMLLKYCAPSTNLLSELERPLTQSG